MPQPASRPFNVLVVDDEPDVPDLLVEYFRDSGHTVTPVSTDTPPWLKSLRARRATA
jgi:CheY-like chemotaxis protein